MIKRFTQKGFTLPEILIGIAVLVMAILTATSLLVSITRSNKSNMNDLTAYYLASEGIEAVRNVRDTQWMNNLKWTGDKKYDFWSMGAGIDFEQGGTYIVSRKVDRGSLSGALPKQKVKSAAPWVFTKINENDKDKPITKLNLMNFSDTKQFMHSSHLSSGMRLNDQFSRYVVIETDDKKMTVTSVVSWMDVSSEREIKLSTVLTDWKAGPS